MNSIPTIPVWDLLGREPGGNIKFWESFQTEKEAGTRLSGLLAVDSNLSYSIEKSLSIVPDRTLPTPEQVRGLCGMLHLVLVAIRSMGYGGRTEAIIDLTDRLHNLPAEMFDPVNWDWNMLEASLAEFESRFPEDSLFRFSETVRTIRNQRTEGGGDRAAAPGASP